MGSGGGNGTTQTTTQELSPQQQSFLDLALPAAQNFVRAPPESLRFLPLRALVHYKM